MREGAKFLAKTMVILKREMTPMEAVVWSRMKPYRCRSSEVVKLTSRVSPKANKMPTLDLQKML